MLARGEVGSIEGFYLFKWEKLEHISLLTAKIQQRENQMLLEGEGAWLGDGGEETSTWRASCDFSPQSCLPFTPGRSLTRSGRAMPRLQG